MLEWTYPASLVALGVVALVWWLHRRALHLRGAAVSAAFLWQAIERQPSVATQRAPTDPIWWLRAALCACVVLALAKPTWITNRNTPVDVWLDDSLSMATIENGHSRYVSAIELLTQQLSEQDSNNITLHSLRQPARAMRLNESRSSWPAAIGEFSSPAEEPLQPPEPLTLPATHTHWLVTDGADRPLSVWAQSAQLTRVIRAGELSDDVSLTNLSVRRVPGRPSRWVGRVTLTASGEKAWRVPLSIATAELTIANTFIDVPAGADIVYQFEVPVSAIGRTLTAHIEPKDALIENNRLQLTTDSLSLVVLRLAGTCSPYVHAALKSHPGVSLARDDGPATLNLVCGDAATGLTGPTLQFHASNNSATLASPLHWHKTNPTLSSLALEPQWLHGTAPGDNSARPVLTLGDETLISASDTAQRRVDVWFDMQSRPLVLAPQYPLLVAGLLQLAAERDLLDPMASASHSSEEANIKPTSTATPTATMHKPSLHGADLSGWLVATALALLIADAMWTYRRNRRYG